MNIKEQKDQPTSVSGNCTKHVVGGRAWRFVKLCMKGEYQLWNADYWCPDGDGIELYIGKEHFELSCFSGIGASVIKMDSIEFPYMQDKVKELDFREPFEMQCVKIADFFCQILCEYKDVSNYTDVSK